MRPEERDPAHLWDMLEAAHAIMEFTGSLSLEEFLAAGKDGEVIRLAIERKLEILGEAGRRISPNFRNAHPEIPWKEIVGLRNVISHQYEKVNYTEIYGIVRRQIPGLIALLEPLMPPLPRMEE
ncbi:MAG: DUF86 domain-containing protein [Nitrospirae bacterium]|nr:DUF86 domain-containing protein [Nitrospirota bacterium]